MKYPLLFIPLIALGQITSPMVENVPISLDAGLDAPSYQWSLNGVEIPGATNRIYFLDSPQEADAGTYVVRGPSLMKKFTFTFVKAVRVLVDGKTVVGDRLEVSHPATVTLVPWFKGAPIRFTVDGTEPTAASTLYTRPFILKQTITIRAAIIIPEGDSTKLIR